MNKKYIFFSVSLTDKIIDSSYQNKYDLNSIVRLLNLIPNKYTDLNSVLKRLNLTSYFKYTNE